MKFYNLYGKLVNKNLNKYLIKWDGKCRSNYEFKLKQFLKRYLISHIVYAEAPVLGSKMTIDILDMTTKIAYEMQGEQHLEYNPFFHNGSRANYLSQIKRDASKLKFCELNNIKMVEIYPEDLNNLSKEYFKENFDVDL